MPPHYTILGGGISGLSLAYFLRQRIASTLKQSISLLSTTSIDKEQINQLLNATITIIESKPRVGGWIETNDQHGHVFERGPRGFRPNGNGVEILRLAEDLGLSNAAVKTSTESKHRFLYVEGQLQQMPAGLSDLLQLPSVLRGAIQGILREPFQPKGLWSDETIDSFVTRRFGKHVARNIVGGMVSGIYGGDITKLSIKSCFPRLYDLENEHGSIIKGMLKKTKPNIDPFQGPIESDSSFIHEYSKAAQVSFIHGLEQLTTTLEKELLKDENVTIVRGDEVVGVCNNGSESDKGDVHVTLQSGTVIKSDHIFSTLPSKALSTILQEQTNIVSDQVIHILNEMETCDIGIVNMAFNDESFIKKPGFGYLIPGSENEKVLGVSFDSCIFPEQTPSSSSDVNKKNKNKNENENENENEKEKGSVVCVMVGGVNCLNVKDMNKDELLEEAKTALSKHLQLDRKDIDAKLKSNVIGIVNECIPQYRVGHSANVKILEKEFKKDLPELTILGTPFYGVGLADAVSKAKKISVEFGM